MDPEMIKKVYDKIESYRASFVELQRRLTAVPALGPENGGEGEAEKAKVIEEWMQGEIGFDTLEHYNSPDGRVPSGYRPNLVAVMKGASSTGRRWIMAHMDVVPPGDESLWETDPYEVVEKDGMIFGRGVEDNQHGMVTALFAAKAIKELGITPPHDIGLALVADEETGSNHGIQYLLSEHDIFKEDDIIVVPDSGVPDGGDIEVAEKSILWLKFETEGKSCHASSPDQGINAHRAAAHLITRLDKLQEIYDARDEVFDPPMSTFEPTKKDGNVPNINTLPGLDVFYMDMRILPGIDLDDVMGKIEEICSGVEKDFSVQISVTSPQREAAAPATPPDAPAVKSLAAAIKDVYGIEARPVGIGGGTCAAFFRRAGFKSVVWSKIDDVCHQPNEFTHIDNMLGDAKVFAHLFLQD